MSKRLGGIKGCKYKTSSWHSNRFPDADNIVLFHLHAHSKFDSASDSESDSESDSTLETNGHFSVKQSDKPKYVAHVFGRAVSNKYTRQHYNYDTPKYVAYILGGDVSKRYRRFPITKINDTL